MDKAGKIIVMLKNNDSIITMYGGTIMVPLGLRYLFPFLPLACIMDTLKPRHGSVEHEENDDDGENRHSTILNAPSHEWR